LFILTLDGAVAVTPSALLVCTDGTIQMKGHTFHPSPRLFWDLGIANMSMRNSSSPSTP
jgi:hypothetical protein